MVEERAPKGGVEVLPPEDGDEAALVPLRFRHDGWTAERQRGFLRALGDTGCVRDACRAAKRSSTSAYKLRARSPEFAAAWDRALEMAATVLEQTAFERAVIGIEEPVWRYGKQVGTKRRYSDSLLKLLIQRGDVRAGLGEKREDLVRAAHDAARAAGGIFCDPATEEETNRAIMKQLAALDRRIKAKDPSAISPEIIADRRARANSPGGY